ncbi:hypothetical protein Hdeb2414_s0014g00425361 [Helianthus debilis subsp. tardiflorus]
MFTLSAGLKRSLRGSPVLTNSSVLSTSMMMMENLTHHAGSLNNKQVKHEAISNLKNYYELSSSSRNRAQNKMGSSYRNGIRNDLRLSHISYMLNKSSLGLAVLISISMLLISISMLCKEGIRECNILSLYIH